MAYSSSIRSELKAKLDDLKDFIQEHYLEINPGHVITNVEIFIGGLDVFYHKVNAETPEKLASILEAVLVEDRRVPEDLEIIASGMQDIGKNMVSFASCKKKDWGAESLTLNLDQV